MSKWCLVYTVSFLAFGFLKAIHAAPQKEESNPPQVSPPAIGMTLRALAGPEVGDAKAAFDAGNLSECEASLNRFREKRPYLPATPILIALMAMDQGRLPEAITRLETYLTTNATDPIAYLSLGEIALRSGRWTDAGLQLQQASTVQKSNPISADLEEAFELRFLQLLAETTERRQQWAKAVELYKQCLQRDPKSTFPLIALSRIRIAQRDIPGALMSLVEAKKLDDKIPQPELAVAMDMAQGPFWKESEKLFESGLKAKDATIANWLEYGRWMLLHDRPAEVVPMLKTLQEEDNKLRDVRFLRGLTARFLGQVAEAETIFSSLHQENPDDLEAADQLALVLIEQTDEGKRGRASQISEANFRRAPQVETTIATAAWVQFKLGSVETADRMLGELTRQTSISPQTAFYVAELFKHRGKMNEAKQVLETAVQAPGIFVDRLKVIKELKSSK